ncbi:hypothetical protein [Granulosicoccus antarcticus]|uniref:DUF481 domain-containing protein n=1 Tax=Granulosicoccus antarcticus IMCC3135 TaxID=1192854 RepID=A0A2Z2NQF4_9GAMM|nr:hypothetical protein [Granulosicoccus antarcticus]ASJ72705.1 hypothetical protein IMCC3135_13085 [Granulosicoccus antarcticus IMCC3135]
MTLILSNSAPLQQHYKSGITRSISSVAVTIALGTISSSVFALELTDYTEPDTEFDEAYIDFNANANDGNQDQTSYDALLNGFYNHQESTKDRVLNYRFGANYDASRGPSDDDRTRDDYGASLGVSSDNYFSETQDKLFWFGAADYAFQDSAEDDSAGFSVGIGYGRVWNATPLAKVLRIQEDLQETGQITGDISDEGARELADIVAKEDQYRAQEGEDTYRGVWYAEMEEVLRKEGLLAGDTLSALGAVRLDDVLFDEPISARRHGWLARAGVGMQLREFSGTVDNDPKLRFELEYAKPYGLTGQLLETAVYEPVFGDDTVHIITNRLSYTYEISDRVDWLNAWNLSFQQVGDEDDTRFVTNELTSTFLYHLTNELDLGLTLAANDEDVRPDNDNGDDEVNKSAVLGIRYRVK